MAVRRTIPLKTRKAEGVFLKARLAEKGISQVDLSNEFSKAFEDVTSTLVGHWCGGFSPIPDIDLLRLGRMLEFNAFELRPSLLDYAEYFELGEILKSIPDQARQQVLWILDVSQKSGDKGFGGTSPATKAPPRKAPPLLIEARKK